MKYHDPFEEKGFRQRLTNSKRGWQETYNFIENTLGVGGDLHSLMYISATQCYIPVG